MTHRMYRVLEYTGEEFDIGMQLTMSIVSEKGQEFGKVMVREVCRSTIDEIKGDGGAASSEVGR